MVIRVDIREKLADLVHQQWIHWMRYMVDNSTEENIQRWVRQMNTAYADLSEKEKDSDREWADKILEVIING
jgi:hypothetical protein